MKEAANLGGLISPTLPLGLDRLHVDFVEPDLNGETGQPLLGGSNRFLICASISRRS
jgi:hypothetical protein